LIFPAVYPHQKNQLRIDKMERAGELLGAGTYGSEEALAWFPSRRAVAALSDAVFSASLTTEEEESGTMSCFDSGGELGCNSVAGPY
jgi:hypothetical protein